MSKLSVTTNRTYYPGLDVLRGIAILLVLFSHNFSFLAIFKIGWVGVDLFFVLSGFLITDILVTTQSDKHFFRNFYARRALRIFPLYYGVLTTFFILAPYFLSKQHLGEYNFYHQNKAWFLADLQNWLFVRKGLGPSNYLSHFWSLAVEEQFYIIWPLLVFSIRDLKKIQLVAFSLVGVAILVRVSLWYLYPADFPKYYCNTLTRMDSILVGCLLALFIRRGKEISKSLLTYFFIFSLTFFASAILLGKSLLMTNPFFATFGYSIVSLFFACLLYLFVKKDHAVVAWLKKSIFLNYIGRISYGIYVLHIPIYLILSGILMNVLINNCGMNSGQTFLVISISSLAVTLIASSLSFYLFERPILTLKKYFQ